MANNLTIESPNFDKIDEESGHFTADAVNLLWQALNETRAELRRGVRRATDMIEPKVLQITAAASVDNLDLQGCSTVEFIGASAQNFTGMRAPETGRSRVVVVYVTGNGTITAKHNVTSETASRLRNELELDTVLVTGTGTAYVYLSGQWRELA